MTVRGSLKLKKCRITGFFFFPAGTGLAAMVRENSVISSHSLHFVSCMSQISSDSSISMNPNFFRVFVPASG